MLWKSCLKLNLEQLSHSMSVVKISPLANNIFCFATNKLTIFLQNMLWKSCLKLNLEQLSHSMSVVNIFHLADTKENMSHGQSKNIHYRNTMEKLF